MDASSLLLAVGFPEASAAQLSAVPFSKVVQSGAAWPAAPRSPRVRVGSPRLTRGLQPSLTPFHMTDIMACSQRWTLLRWVGTLRRSGHPTGAALWQPHLQVDGDVVLVAVKSGNAVGENIPWDPYAVFDFCSEKGAPLDKRQSPLTCQNLSGLPFCLTSELRPFCARSCVMHQAFHRRQVVAGVTAWSWGETSD